MIVFRPFDLGIEQKSLWQPQDYNEVDLIPFE